MVTGEFDSPRTSRQEAKRQSMEVGNMMQSEFEALYGHEVTSEDYWDIIQPMYMATKLNKEEFVKTLDKKRFALKTSSELIKLMKAECKHLKETCEHYYDTQSNDRFRELFCEWNSRFQLNRSFVETDYTLMYGRGCAYPRWIWDDMDGHYIDLMTGKRLSHIR